MHGRKFLILWLNHFVPLGKRLLKLIFRKNNIPQFINIDWAEESANEINQAYKSSVRLLIQVQNIYALRINSTYIPILEDDLQIRISLPLEEGKNTIELKALGFFKSRQKILHVNRKKVDIINIFPPKKMMIKSRNDVRLKLPELQHSLKIMGVSQPKLADRIRINNAELNQAKINSIKQPKIQLPLEELKQEIKHRVKTEIINHYE